MHTGRTAGNTFPTPSGTSLPNSPIWSSRLVAISILIRPRRRPHRNTAPVLLPLWSQNLDVHAGKPYFSAFKALITALTPILNTWAKGFKLSFGPDGAALHERAPQSYQNYIANPNLMFQTIFPAGEIKALNCFRCMRLSANPAREKTRLDAGDGSRLAALAGFGAAKPRVFLTPGNLTKQMEVGGDFFVRPGIAVHTAPYVGEWCLLELFLPR
jgi:hypothetical protein